MAMARKKKNKKKQHSMPRQILGDNVPFAVTEAYKSARTNLMFMLADNKKKCVGITSAMAGDGKTTTCANIAITFAQTGAKTLIIDGDMRKPQQHKSFSVPSSPGLSDVLGGFCKQEDCILRTDVDNLYLIPAGTIPPNPAELLSSEMMTKLLDSCINDYGFDYIFIDTPPINVVTDAAAMGSKIAGMVMVVRSGSTQSDNVKAAVDSLTKAGINLLGFVLNDVNAEKYSYRYHKRYYSGKYYSKYDYRYSYKYGYTE